MPLDLLPKAFVCAPVGKHLTQRLGPYHGYAKEDAASEAAGSGPRYDAHFNPVDGAFWFYDAEAEAWHSWKGEDVGLAVLYPIGEGAWRWDCGA